MNTKEDVQECIKELSRKGHKNVNNRVLALERLIADDYILDKYQGIVVPALIEALKDKETKVRIVAIGVLGEAFSKVNDKRKKQMIIPALIKAFDDTDVEVRIATINGLEEIFTKVNDEIKNQTIVPVLIKAFGNPNVWTKVEATKALGKVFPKANDERKKEILDILLTAFVDIIDEDTNTGNVIGGVLVKIANDKLLEEMKLYVKSKDTEIETKKARARMVRMYKKIIVEIGQELTGVRGTLSDGKPKPPIGRRGKLVRIGRVSAR